MNVDYKNVETESNEKTNGVDVSELLKKERAEKIWKERLCALDFERQKRIAVKYYNGHMPWRG